MNINYEGLIRQLMTGDRTTMKIAADVIRDLLSDLATTRTALAAAEKDAERYRWLRSPQFDVSVLFNSVDYGDSDPGSAYAYLDDFRTDAALDERIDAARAEDRQGKSAIVIANAKENGK